ncbi:hypothetical protein HUU05_04555 [candidate division KSB1 bacterium]|nr:hypothetical protein [candidate division KSB1 bacterium]
MKKLKINPRPALIVSLPVPIDALEQLQQIAKARELGLHSLLKLYIGEGLRNDLPLVKKQRQLY